MTSTITVSHSRMHDLTETFMVVVTLQGDNSRPHQSDHDVPLRFINCANSQDFLADVLLLTKLLLQWPFFGLRSVQV